MSNDGDGTTPWAFIAHKDKYWGGVCSSSADKKTLREFVGDFAAKGFSIKTVMSREEYLAFIEPLDIWRGPSKEIEPELDL